MSLDEQIRPAVDERIQPSAAVDHPHEKPPRSGWSRLRSVLGWIVILAAAVLAWPTTLGGGASWVVVSGESMEPTFYTGDLIVAWRSNDWKVGDVVVYNLASAGMGGVNVAHRLSGGDAQEGWLTKGDNKPRPDPWRVSDDNVLGRVYFHIPYGGRVLQILRTPLVFSIIAGILVTMAILADPPAHRGRRHGHRRRIRHRSKVHR